MVLVALLALVGLTSLIWGTPGPSATDPARLEPGESPFPIFQLGTTLHVVSIGSDVNYSTRLTLLSLQGLVNRKGVELYLDVRNEASDASSMLSFISRKYELTYDIVDINWTLDRYLRANTTSGFVVYDPGRPESVNIATMYAAIYGATIVGPDNLASLRRLSGLPVLLDYAASDWARLDPVETTDQALRELFPLSKNRNLLSILPPHRWAIRDYLIATGTFVFYNTQGALAAPWEISSTERVLQAAPRGIPIIGWFDSPTLTEENLFIQMASREGKFVVGVQDTPNLTVLTALGRNQTFRQSVAAPPLAPLENKTYVVVAVADGDSLDFVADRMRVMWNSTLRGSYPIAWSLNPLLTELAPPYIDYYYSTASAVDRFVASPSGAGYLYPDYMDPGDLRPFLEFSKRHLDAADMDVVWLLNAFIASEIQYSSASLSAYVETLSPRGLVLDYHDEPGSRAFWMQGAPSSATPVVRSTHLWTSKSNFLAKFQAAMDSRDDGPHFVWMTVYPWRFDLDDVKDVLAGMAARTQGEMEVVTPETLFTLLTLDFQSRARQNLEEMRTHPLATTFLAGHLTSAEARIDSASAFALAGDANRAAYDAFLGTRDLRDAAMWEAILIMVMVAAVLAVPALVLRGRAGPPSDRAISSLRTFLLLSAITGLFLLALRATLEGNFWTYHFVVLGVAAAGVASPLHAYLNTRFPRRSTSIAALLLLVSVAATLWSNAAFPLAILFALLSFESVLARNPGSPAILIASFPVGFALGSIGALDFPVFAGLAALLVAPLATAPQAEISVRAPRRAWSSWIAGFLVALPLSALIISHYHSVSLRVELQGDELTTLGVSLLLLCPVTALSVAAIVRRDGWQKLRAGALILVAAFMISLLFVRGAVTTALLLLGMLTSLSLAAVASLHLLLSRGGDLSSVALPAFTAIPVLLLFMRMPPVAYSLILGSLPEPVEYALYAPQAIFGMIAGALVVVVAVPRSRKG